MSVVGYVRVSTERQAVEGVSPEAQKARIEAWAVAHDRPVLEVFSDALSGKRAANRPGLQAALALACDQGAALVVYSLSRLARSTADALAIAETLRKSRADLVSLSESLDTTSAAGKMVFRVLAVLAEFERDLVSERTRDALAHKKAQRERVGAVPYGSRLAPDGRHLVDHPEHAGAIALIRASVDAGRSCSEVRELLQAHRYPTASGKPWHRSTVARLLRRYRTK